MKIDEANYNLIKRAEELTLTNYSDEIYWKDAENIDGYIEDYVLINIIEDLILEVGNREEEIEDLKNDLESNYVRVSISDQVDITDRDFI